MSYLNNPAGRLLYWLREADTKRKDLSALTQWCEVWSLDPNTIDGKFECMRRGAMLMSLAVRVREDAALLPGNLHPDVMLNNFGEVESALDRFTVLASISLNDFFTPLTGMGWQSLEMANVLLGSNRPEPGAVMEAEAIRDHLVMVRDLITQVLKDEDLDPEVKQYIVARLRDVERALIDASFAGSGEVELAVNSLFGAVQREPDMWDRVARSKWGPRIGKMVGSLLLVLGSAGGLPALMPGDPAPVEISNTVIVNNTPAEPDVVDAEIVEDTESPPSAEDGQAARE